MSKLFAVTYRVPTGPLVTVDVLADCGSDAAAAVRGMVPTAQLVETRGKHYGLDTVSADVACGGCGHAAKLHTTEEWIGDWCEHYGAGSGSGSVPESRHSCSCQGFWPATT